MSAQNCMFLTHDADESVSIGIYNDEGLWTTLSCFRHFIARISILIWDCCPPGRGTVVETAFRNNMIQPYKIPMVTGSIVGVRFEVGKFAFFDQYHR